MGSTERYIQTDDEMEKEEPQCERRFVVDTWSVSNVLL